MIQLPTTPRIQGVMRAGHPGGGVPGEAFDLPLISHIEGNLYIGGMPSELPTGFKTVICMTKGGPDYHIPAGVAWMRVPIDDDASQSLSHQSMSELAQYINARRRTEPVLIHCRGGINRSALVAAIALIENDISPEAAISLLREKRGRFLLCNVGFERFVRQHHVGNRTCWCSEIHMELDV